jgi:hypothetical protein
MAGPPMADECDSSVSGPPSDSAFDLSSDQPIAIYQDNNLNLSSVPILPITESVSA